MKKLTCIVAVFCMMTFWVVAAAPAEDTYCCKCKGIKELVLFWYQYGDCGNGFVGGNKGDVKKNISEAGLNSYIPPGVSGPIKSGTTPCGYYPDSGWNCGKMNGTATPPCLDD